MKEYYIDRDDMKVKVINIRAGGFTIYPPETITKAVTIEAELYNLKDEEDFCNYSRIIVKINLKELLNEIEIRWDLAR